MRGDDPARGVRAGRRALRADGQLGEFVLRRALADARRWPDLYIAVNLSPVQVRDPALVDLVSDVLAETGIAPSRV